MTYQMTEDQFKNLLDTISRQGGTTTIEGRPGSFSNCTARFSGERDHEKVNNFTTTVSIYKDIEKISDANAIRGLPLLFTDEAATWWQGIKDGVTTWDQAITKIKSSFAPEKPAYQIYTELFIEKQDAKTPTDSFLCKKRALLSQLPEARHDEVTQIDLVYGLLNIRIRDKISRDSVTTFNALIQKAREIEAIDQEMQMSVPNKPQLNNINKKLRCQFCGYKGHSVDQCRKKAKVEDSVRVTEVAKQKHNTEMHKPSGLACYGCGTPGVFRSNCPTCKKNKTQASLNLSAIEPIVKLGKDPPTVALQIFGTIENAHIDTGARTSIAGTKLYHRLQRNNCSFVELTADITLADGVSKQQKVFTTNVEVYMGGRRLEIQFLILPEANDNNTLLGMDFLEENGIVLNIAQKVWSFVSNPNKQFTFELSPEYAPDMLPEQNMAVHQRNQRTSNKRGLNISSSPDWYLDCDASPMSESGTSEINFKENPNWKLMKFETPPKPQRSQDDYNPSEISKIFKDTLPVGMTTPKKDPRTGILYYSPTSIPKSCFESIDISLRADEATELTEHERKKLNILLAENGELYRGHLEITPFIEHSINTEDRSPIAVPPYRLSPLKRKQLEEEIDKMLQEDIIEESESPWAFPVVLVPKKDGGVRVCIDYRQLNKITVPDRYPLPRLDDLLHNAKGTAFMTTLDLRSSYWQIQVKACDQDKTTFTTPLGTYKFKRMPFGLRNAPATFQRLMDKFKSSLTTVCILTYLDDLIVCSSTFEQHLQDLNKVFQRLKLFKLKVKREKCRFCCAKVKYLGHILTKEGIVPDPGKIKSILDWPTPHSLKHLVSFLQTCSWYRRFISHFADVARPLTKLTKKNAKWEWSKEQEKAFEDLKQILTTAPVLKQANETTPFIIKTDASGYAVGAVLVQGEGSNEHPIEYASRLLTSAEQNYSTTEREALAIVWAISRFRGYIEGVQTTIITDHQPLKWLMSLKSPSGRLARWALTLQSYDLNITYAPGKTNVIADCLSRPPCDDKSVLSCSVCSTQVDLPHKGAQDLRDDQMKDVDLKNIIECLEDSGNEEKYVRWSKQGYLMNNGVLYRYVPDIESSEEAQLVVPKDERETILKEYHDAPTAGHYGVERTFQRIASRYYWNGMRRDIVKHVSGCHECQRYKSENLKPAGLLQTTVSGQRFEVVAVDLFGPLPLSDDNKRWILIVEDTTSRWVELFALTEATAENCSKVLLEEVFLRYGLPRRLISDNGTQFISSIMQKLTYCLGIRQVFTPVYHPQANPVERKNRDLKAQLAILVGNDHKSWPNKLSAIRFAMNSAMCKSTGRSAAFLTFGRELRTPDDVYQDTRSIVQTENFVPQVTPRLLQLLDVLKEAKDNNERETQRLQKYADKKHRPDPGYQPGDRVWVKSHHQSKASASFSSKLAPRKDGPYVILNKHGAATYEIAAMDSPTTVIGTYHTSVLSPYSGDDEEVPKPVKPIRKRGRPKKLSRRNSNNTC